MTEKRSRVSGEERSALFSGRSFGINGSMDGARAVDVHVFDPISAVRNGAAIHPLIGFRGVLRLGAAEKERGAGDERRIDALAAFGPFAINVEAEVAGFFLGFPFEEDGAIGLREGVEGGDVHGGGRLDGGEHGGAVVIEIGIAGDGSDAGGVAGKRAGAERVGGDVDGEDHGAADTTVLPTPRLPRLQETVVVPAV